VHCPIIHVWGVTDDPMLEPSGLFVGGAFFDLTSGFSYTHYPSVTASGAVYSFDETIDLSTVTTVRPGDRLRIRIWDRHTDLIDVIVVCAPVIPPVTRFAYEMRIIHCNIPILQGPAGPPLGNFKVSAGQKRPVLPKPVPGSDGQLYTQIWVNAKLEG